MNTWQRLLANTTVRQLITETKKNRPLVTVRHSDTVDDILETLQRENILSVPVIYEEEQFIGIVDILDIAGYLLASWRRASPDLERGEFPEDEFFETRAQAILNFSEVDPSIYLKVDQSVLDLIKVFSNPLFNFRLHRVVILDEDGLVFNVVSQSDVVAFAYQHKHELPDPLINVQLQDFNYMIRTPVLVRIDTPFVEALDLMWRNRISGLALVNENFKLNGNLSASDLRGMYSFSFEYFNNSVLQFLTQGTDTTIKSPIRVTPNTTFMGAIKTLVENRIHRVYITNAYDYPVGVVSLFDIISRLI